jgi:hypothetical protein
MRALSIRQPFAELILRGIKTVELRSRATSIVGDRFYIYASKGPGAGRRVWSEDLRVAQPPGWMIELMEQIRMIEPDAILPKGVIVGTARIVKCVEIRDQGSDVRQRGLLTSDLRPLTSGLPDLRSLTSDVCMYAWHLADVKRLTRHRKPTKHPQPVWFNPF